MSPPAQSSEKLIARNQRALTRFDIEERIEGGLVLAGSEVKSLRLGRADLEGAFATISNGECFLHNLFIAPYEQATVWGHEPKRVRKVLLHASEIEKWAGRITMRGYTIVPLRLYFKNGRCKVELGLGKGRKLGDDREKVKKKADLEEARSAMQRSKSKALDVGGKGGRR
ncbi:MAG: SsrA-binding protein SmpB [Sandaracinaceae bacterium]|nr:SsrA-binding protein SmpB [Sandaracinaceae bacterium]